MRGLTHQLLFEPRAPLRWNVVFHDAVARAAHGRHLKQAMEGVRMELFLPAGLLLRKQPANDLRRAHADLFDAIRDRDPERARETMHGHLSQTQRGVATALAELADAGVPSEE